MPIEWAVAHLSHVQRFFEGLYPDAPIAYGAALWTKHHALAEQTVVRVTLTPESEVRVVVDDGRLALRVRPSKADPLRSGRYAVEERWYAYEGRHFEDVVAELARF